MLIFFEINISFLNGFSVTVTTANYSLVFYFSCFGILNIFGSLYINNIVIIIIFFKLQRIGVFFLNFYVILVKTGPSNIHFKKSSFFREIRKY